jgi:hypothetical protein
MATNKSGIIIDEYEPSSGLSDKSEGRKPESPRIAGFDVTSPADFIDGGTGGDGITSGKRRGRPRGSKNRTDPATSKTPQNIAENLETLLLSVHLMGAAFLKCPELELSQPEAEKLAGAVREVAKHYNVVVNPKTLALIELSTTGAMIYGTRGVAIYKRLTAEAKPKPVPGRVQTIRDNPPPAAEQPAPEKRPLNPSDLFGDANGVIDSSVL